MSDNCDIGRGSDLPALCSAVPFETSAKLPAIYDEIRLHSKGERGDFVETNSGLNSGGGMEPIGSTYLYALAAVAITFVGFSALLVIFRQARGDALTRYESYFVLSFIQPGLIVTGGALLPSVFALYGLSVPAVWRLSSILVAIPILVFVTTLPSRRRAATGRKTIPLYVRVIGSLDFAIAVYLIANAGGVAASNGVGPYAASLTALLLTTVTAYVIALSVALGEAPGTTTD